MTVRFSDLVSVARLRAANHPTQIAYTFLLEHDDVQIDLTYEDLDRRAQQVAAWLQQHSIQPGARVLLLFPPGIDYIVALWGCLYAGAIAVPMYPPRRARANRFAERFQKVLEDAQSSVALTTSALYPLVADALQQFSQTNPFLLLTTDALPDALPWHETTVSAQQIAFLQYTSGTTAEPKGVMLTHENVLHNLEMMYQFFGNSSETRGVIWLPPYHDMGLIGGLLQPLYGGFPVTLMAPTTFLQKPVRWLETISRIRATSSGGPNFAYDLCVQRITAEQKAQLDLSSWRVAFNGAEPVRQSTLEQFSQAFSSCGFRSESFYPCYGLAEATLMVTGKQVEEAPTVQRFVASALETHTVVPEQQDTADARSLVACGHTIPEHTLLIVDPATHQPLADRQIGEIWLHGPGVAKGYWQQPELTDTTFQAHLSTDQTGQRSFLRTGDLGFLDTTLLYVTGRLKDLIIIRGRNYYPQDIELTAGQCHESLLVGNGAAFTIPVAGEERLVIVYELTRVQQHADLDVVLQTIKQAISLEYEFSPYAIVLIRTGTLPRTTSGKIQRQLCRTYYLNGQLHILAETTRSTSTEALPALDRAKILLIEADQRQALLTTYLCSQIAHLLQSEITEEQALHPLISLGLDSLQSVDLKHHIQNDFQVPIDLEELLSGISIEQIASKILFQIEQGVTDVGASVSASHNQELATTLSHGQHALWFTQQATVKNHAYTLFRAFAITQWVDRDALKKAFLLLTERHASLTTTFPLHNGKPVRQTGSFTVDNLPCEIIDGTHWSEEQIQACQDANAEILFNLEQGPLFKITLLQRSEEAFLLFFAIHHLIIDAWSLPIVCEDLGALYSALLQKQTLPPVKSQADYTSFVQWQADILASAHGEESGAYWRQQFTSLPPDLNLPTSQPRSPLLQTRAGGTERININAELTRQLKKLCQQEQVTLSTLLVTAFSTLLQRYTNQDDICIGMPYFGRDQAELASIAGYCVNMLPLRVDLSGQPSFLALLQRTRQKMLANLSRQEYPFSMLVHDLHATHDTQVSSLEQVAFIMQSGVGSQSSALAALTLGDCGSPVTFGSLTLEPLRCDTRSAQRDLSLAAAEDGSGVRLALEYDSSLFEKTTIQRLLANFLTLLSDIAVQPQTSIGALRLVDTDELRLLQNWNVTQPGPSGNMVCLHHLFSAQAYLSPEVPALIFGEQTLTYARLERSTNQLAHLLQERGVGPDVLVGLCMERSLELVICILAILKAGGAYVPLDPTSPSERLAFMIADTQLALILTQQPLLEHLPEDYRSRALCIDQESHQAQLAHYPETFPLSHMTTDNLAYVIYTSGSTGKPKGTMISHENVIRLLTATHDWYQFNTADVWTLFHSYAFDVSVWELWGALTYGGCLVIVPYWVSRSPQEFAQLLVEHKVTILNQTPTAFRQFAEYQLQTDLSLSLRLIIFAGEALVPGMLQPWFARYGDQHPQLVNMYGITETTVHVTAHFLREHETISNVGRPMQDLQIYLFDEQQRLVPIGVPGEIYVGGPGLARGYLHRSDLTAERFVPHLFSQTGGERLYRSGDLARYLADGSLEYLGRIDHQVKIRGFRVEPGEIETKLASHPALRECVVILRQDHAEHHELVAYYTLASAKEQPSPQELRSFLQNHLPIYMLPTAFLLLDSLPLTLNGKLDRRALPAPAYQSLTSEQVYVAPRTPEEEIMVAIWQQVLERDALGIDDNFFELGGDSIRSIQIVSLARQYNLYCSVQQIFMHQCIRELIAHLLAEPVDALLQRPVPFSLLTPTDRDHMHEMQIIDELEDAYPVTTLQAGLIFHSQFHDDYERYITSLELEVVFQQELFEQALIYLTARHEMLRTSFDLTHYGETLQCVHGQALPYLQVIDLRHLTATEQDEAIATWIEREKRRTVAWEKLPLAHFFVHLRNDQSIQVTLSEPFLDGWSVSSLLTELLKTYSLLLTQATLPEMQRLDSTFAAYVCAEQQQIQSPSSRQFWQAQMQDAPVSSLPIWHSEESEQEPRRASHIERYYVEIEPHLSDTLKQVASQYKLPLKSLLVGVHLKVMGLLYGISDVTTGVLFNGRMEHRDGDRVPGIFLNALPMRVNIARLTWIELARVAQSAEQAMLQYRRFPIGTLQQMLGVPKLFETVFNFTHFHAYQPIEQLEEVKVLNGYASEQTFFPLTTQCNLDHLSSHLRMALDYDVARLSPAQIEAIAGYYQFALNMLATQPEQPARNVQMLSLEESTQLLKVWNHAPTTPLPPVDVLSLFAEQVSLVPDNRALACGDIELTYRELDQQINHLASVLQQHAIGPDRCVGVCMERTPILIIALLGILRAGGAYVALDPTYPTDRLAFMAQDANVSLIITQEHLLKLLPATLPEVILLNSHQISVQNASEPVRFVQTTPDNLAYITYTSGSTGVPKGVMVTRGGVIAFVQWALTAFTREQLKYVLASTSICFDLSVFEIFVPLSCGGTVVLAQDGLHLLEVADRYELTLINTVPSVLHEILREHFLPGSIQVVNMGAEALPHALATVLHQQQHELLVYDLYGPSEATVYSTYAQIPPAPRLDPAIGNPITGTYIYVLDDQMQPVPIGVAGELYIGGLGLARGYYQRLDTTATRFVPNPFGDSPGSRLYRTGDQVRFRIDGQIEFLERLDLQVKIRGFRIELGEIEAVLTEHDAIQVAVVIVREDVPGDKRLAAYIMFESGKTVGQEEIRDFLRQRLPPQMLPNAIIFAETLPLTLNGKVDRRAIQAQPLEIQYGTSTFVAPETEMEQEIATIWAEVLHLPEVGRKDNFFMLGGHSLSATQVVSRLRSQFSLELTMTEFFQTATLADLATLLEQRQVLQEDTEFLNLIAQVEQLSDDEVSRLLFEKGISQNGSRITHE